MIDSRIRSPSEPGRDTWNGAPPEQRYGGALWVAGSYDPATNLIYFSIAGTYNMATLFFSRGAIGGKNNRGLYTGSTIAVNPDTGKLVWRHRSSKPYKLHSLMRAAN